MKLLNETLKTTTFQKLFKEVEKANEINSLAGLNQEVLVVYQDGEDLDTLTYFSTYTEFKTYILETYIPGEDILKSSFNLEVKHTFKYGPFNDECSFTVYLGKKPRS